MTEQESLGLVADLLTASQAEVTRLPDFNKSIQFQAAKVSLSHLLALPSVNLVSGALFKCLQGFIFWSMIWSNLFLVGRLFLELL